MRCTKNGIIVRDEEKAGFPATYRRGDLFSCPKCKASVFTGFGDPFTDPSPRDQREAITYTR